MRWWQAAAAARRWLIVAMCLAIALVTARYVGGWVPELVVAGAPVGVVAAGVGWVLSQRVSAQAVARLLDSRLALDEQVATAVAVGSAGQSGYQAWVAERLTERACVLVEQARCWRCWRSPSRWSWPIRGSWPMSERCCPRQVPAHGRQ
jgi:hypothetical protein